jgi:hypothetical protein
VTTLDAPDVALDAPDAPEVHGLAPWARRRSRLVQVALVAGSLLVAAAMLAMLSGTDSFPVGLVLAVAIVILGVAGAWYVRRALPRVRLEIGPSGVGYQAGKHRIEAAWSDVAAVDLVIRGSETGPALVLSADRAVSDAGMLGASIGGAIGGAGMAGASVRSTIPLAAFIEGSFRGSPVEQGLRRHIPDLLEGYFARYPGRDR